MCTGITLASFSMDGDNPDEKDWLNMSARWVEIPLSNSFKILLQRLSRSVDLSLFSEDIIKFPLCASPGVMNSGSLLGWWRKPWKYLFESLILTLGFSAIELK